MATPSKSFKTPQKTPNLDPQLQKTFQVRSSISSIDIHPNSTQIISSCTDNTLYLFNLSAQKRNYHFSGHKGPITDCKFSSTGELIATSSSDNTIRLWQNNVEGKSVALKGHLSTVNSVDFNNNDLSLLSGSVDKTIRLWDIQRQMCQLTLVGHSGSVNSALFSPDNRIIASSSEDLTVKLWDLSQNAPFISFTDNFTANSIRFHPDGTCIAAGNTEGNVHIWDIRTQRVLQRYCGHVQKINSVAFHPSGLYLLTGSSDSCLKIWDLRQGKILYTLFGHDGSVNSVKFMRNGNNFVTAGECGKIMIWNSNLDCGVDGMADMSRNNGSCVGKAEKFVVRVESAEKNSVNRPASRSSSYSKKSNSIEIAEKSESRMGSRPRQHNKRRSEIPENLSLTIDRLVGQLETVTKTLVILEKRFCKFEDHVSMLSSTIKTKQ